MKTAKVYVDVLVRFTSEGEMRPVQLVWEDGRVYHIDRIISSRDAASRKCDRIIAAELRITPPSFEINESPHEREIVIS